MIDTMTANQLLGISEPERVFTQGRLDVIEREWKVLMRKWRPDKNSDPKANDVAAYLVELKKVAVEKVKNGIWDEPGVVTVKSTEGGTFKIRFIAKGDFELVDILPALKRPGFQV